MITGRPSVVHFPYVAYSTGCTVAHRMGWVSPSCDPVCCPVQAFAAPGGPEAGILGNAAIEATRFDTSEAHKFYPPTSLSLQLVRSGNEVQFSVRL